MNSRISSEQIVWYNLLYSNYELRSNSHLSFYYPQEYVSNLVGMNSHRESIYGKVVAIGFYEHVIALIIIKLKKWIFKSVADDRTL